MKKYVVIGAIIILSVIALMTLMIMTSNRDKEYLNHIYSHRGASGEEIEHTFASYDLAILYGSKYIEQDIVNSKDGTLYVSHDLSAKRITGVDKLYSEMTDKEIDELRTKDGQKILKLKDIFDRYRDSDVTFIVELKSKREALEPFKEIVEEYGIQNRIIVQCFDKTVLESAKEMFPNMKTIYLALVEEEFDDALELPYVDIISLNKKYMKKELVERAHSNGKKLNIWTLNTTEEIKSAIEMGIDSYFTNYTAKAMKLEEKYRK